MDPSKRIEELEAQVQELSGLVDRLIAEHPAATDQAGNQGESYRSPTVVQDVRQRVDRVLRGDSDDSIEARIGAVWLSRLAVVVMMTALALAARTTFATDAIGPLQKAILGYGMAVAFTAYGLFFAKTKDLFAQAILGCGLAGLYFTTYAVFFISEMRLIAAPWTGILVLLGCLALLAAVAHRRRSQTVAGIGLFLAYYTVVVSCRQSPQAETFAHALLTCTALAVVTLLFHAAHRWLLFSWAALIATYLTYILFLWTQPKGLGIAPDQYFWISNGFLAVCFLLFSLTCIMDARKTGEYRRMVAPMAGVNSFVFFTLTWFAIRQHYPEQEWIFRSVFAAALLLFAVFAETTGPRRNYLFQIFIAKTVIMITLALESYLSGEKLLVAMAIECLALGFSYKRSGIVVFKALGLILMGITFLGCLINIKMPGVIVLAGNEIPANWFCAGGVAFVFCLVAWFYEKFVRRFRPEHRTVSGQWFLADSFLDLHSATMSIVHAAAAALILLTITILERGNDVALPYLLAGQALLLAALGLILLTPQIEVASVLLLAAAHVCYHIFLWLPVQGFETQTYYLAFTILLALFTYGGAVAWERYLARYNHPEGDFEHHVVAALPYLAATFLLITLIQRGIDPLHVPAAQGTLGMALLLIGSLTRYPGVKASGLMCIAFGAANLYRGIYDHAAPLTKEPGFLLYAGLFLLTCAGAERMLALIQQRENEPSKLENVSRTLMVAAALGLGLIGLNEWCEKGLLSYYVLGLAVIAITLGAVFRESRYRWGALFLFAVLLVITFTRFDELADLHQVLTFGIFAVVLLVVSWAYSRSGTKRQGDSPKK
jgi:hypothetical protein